MNTYSRILCGACLTLATCASTPSEPSYLNRFMDYLAWSKNLPTTPSPAFLTFIDSNAPLSRKLREKWLYTLAKNNDWPTYIEHYQDSDDVSLQCYAQFARYQQHQDVFQASKKIWLTGDNLPPACDKLFTVLIDKNIITNDLILERVQLTLEKRNVSLAKYLVSRAELPSPYEKRTLEIIQKQPTRIASLSQSKLHSNYYLYGLKRLVSSNPKRAIELWEEIKNEDVLNDEQKQAFLTHLALYQAIRNKPDSYQWFNQVTPDAYNETLLDWQIRFALRNHEWARVKTLIELSNKQEEPAWQYWLARAESSLGNQQQANATYEKLAKTRHYYGFLASTRLKQPLAFQQEKANDKALALEEYQLVTEEIKTLYNSNRQLEASRMANDFASELPKNKRSAFIAWLQHTLHWTGKSVYLSGDKSLKDQLTLRFPLAHKKSVQRYAKQYDIPEALVYAIIRQESAFRHDVISPVGAHGLMQLMPKTAQHVARKKRITYHNTKDLFVPDKNIKLGVAYLNELADRFDNNPLLMVAAYNAGPHQVNRWIKTHPIEEIDIWIDTLPWGETRNYLKSVMAFYAVYQHRLDQKANLAAFIHQNITHNNPSKDLQTANQ
ncbi:MAG: lytic transglycosylase domain-containing protein [Gammaproteobacteria bacterium]|nr:lytic transglycosylase domain-containing protein [Gammaproteobacteria bacterium]